MLDFSTSSLVCKALENKDSFFYFYIFVPSTLQMLKAYLFNDMQLLKLTYFPYKNLAYVELKKKFIAIV